MDTNKATGFYAIDGATYYVTPEGRAYFSSVDFDGIRRADDVPRGAAPADGLLTPDEAVEFLRQVEADFGEVLLTEGDA